MNGRAETDLVFNIDRIRLDEWIPWTAGASLVRFAGRSISSCVRDLKVETKQINGQTCVRWRDVWDGSHPKVTDNMRRLDAVQKEMKALMRRYDELLKAVEDEKHQRKEDHTHV